MWAYWLFTALLLLMTGCLCVVACQRDKYRNQADTYRDALWRADPEEARRLTIALQVGLQ